MSAPADTRQRILAAALDEFLQRGLKQASLEAIATRAGLTRVTLYRYFPDRRSLVAAAFLQIVDVLNATRVALVNRPDLAPEDALDQVAAGLARLSRAGLPAGLAELARLYPDLAEQFHAARSAAIQAIFELLFARLNASGRLRPGLNPALVRAFFATSVVHVLEHPSLAETGLPPAELFAGVKDIFLHGILI